MRRVLLSFLVILLTSATLLASPALAAPPDAPANVVATLNGTSAIDVTWEAPVSNGGFELDFYTVSISPATAAPQQVSAATATFSGLTPGTSYTVSVTATNTEPATSAAGTSNSVLVPATAPSAPLAVSASLNGSTAVNVTWDVPSSNGGAALDFYTVSISPATAAPQQVSAAAARTATLSGLTPGTSYTVSVTATNTKPATSAAGTSNSVLVPATVPGAPTNLAGTASTTSIDLTWTAPTNTGGSPLTGYVVSYTTGATTQTKSIVGPSTSTTLTRLAEETSYTITVKATNGVEPGSANSAPITRTTGTSATAPAAPAKPTASLSGTDNQNVTITWVAPNDNGKQITSYTVLLSNGASLPALASARSVEFTGLAAGTTATATVTATNIQGTSEASPASNAVTTASVPGVPLAVSGSWAGETALNSMDIQWSAPANNGDAIEGYIVTVSPALSTPIPEVAGTSTRVSGLEPGQTYTVTVAAKNSIGTGPASASIQVLIPTTPGAVTNVTATQPRPFVNKVTISWSAPTDLGGSPVVGYRVAVGARSVDVPSTQRSVAFDGLAVGVSSATIRTLTLAGEGPISTSPSFEVRAFAPFRTETEFIEQLYADFLKRTPDGPGLAFWVGQTNDDGSNIHNIVNAFMNSPEFSPRRAVARIFLAYFNRQPDKGGFDYWTALLASRQAELQAVSDAFATSAEFQQTYGSLSNAEFIVLVYSNVLVRRPDVPGFNYWLNLLNRGTFSRGHMMTQFSESPEFVAKSRPAVDVTVTYDGMLQREADVDGFKFWRDLVNNDVNSLDTLVRAFFESPEYGQRIDR